jgi:hypothetical protein
MNNSTSRRRYSARAAAIAATAAVILGAAACGSETASDDGKPAAPAPAPVKVQVAPHTPMSADSAERRAQAEYLEMLRRHYSVGIEEKADKKRTGKFRRQSEQAPGHWREIPLG